MKKTRWDEVPETLEAIEELESGKGTFWNDYDSMMHDILSSPLEGQDCVIGASDEDIFTKAIESDEDFKRAVKMVEKYFDMPPPEADPLNDKVQNLIGQIDKYQTNRFSIIDKTDALDALLFMMDQQGLKPEDLIPCLGSLEIVHEVLERRRVLTETMISRLVQMFGDSMLHNYR